MAGGHAGKEKMKKLSKELIERVHRIKLVLTDCDGVLTDGGVYYSREGEEMKLFSVRDGMGVERLRRLVNIETGLVTGENSEIVRKRVEKLGIREYHPGSIEKLSVLKNIIRNRKLSAEEIAYIGDDSNDLEIMKQSGLSACPSDAFISIRETAHLIMENKGGHGAFREFAEIIIYYKKGQYEHTKEGTDGGSHYW